MANLSSVNVSFPRQSNTGINYRPALVALSVLYFMMGLVTCLNDTLVPYFKEGFSLSYTQSSFVQLYFFLTYGVVSIPAGTLVEKIGYKKGMVLGFVIAALGSCLFFPAAFFHTYFIFLLALFVLAIGIVILQVAANPYITSLGAPETASSRLNMVQAIGSLGTTVAPVIGAYFILSKLRNTADGADAVKYPYLIIAILLIFIAVTLSFLPLPSFRIVPEKNKSLDIIQKKISILSFRNLKFGIPAIFMYVGAEVCIGTFLTNYIADTLATDLEMSNKYVAFYWGGMLVGRFIGAAILRFLKTNTILGICAFAAILMIFISVNSTGLIAVWALIAVGLFNSIMFANIFSLAVDGLGKYTTRASGLLSAAISGGAVFSFALGYLRDHFTWGWSFMLPVFAYLYIAFYAFNGYKKIENESMSVTANAVFQK